MTSSVAAPDLRKTAQLPPSLPGPGPCESLRPQNKPPSQLPKKEELAPVHVLAPAGTSVTCHFTGE